MLGERGILVLFAIMLLVLVFTIVMSGNTDGGDLPASYRKLEEEQEELERKLNPKQVAFAEPQQQQQQQQQQGSEESRDNPPPPRKPMQRATKKLKEDISDPIASVPKKVNKKKESVSAAHGGGDNSWKKAFMQRVNHQKACPHLAAQRNGVVSLACDICELLPYLEAYTEENDIVAEAGSRLGSSTTCILNRHTQYAASLDMTITHQLKIMGGYLDHCRPGDNSSRYEMVEGDDIKTGLPVPKVQMLFLDTIHNADQLYKELELFPQYVERWITFHDSHSFPDRDEELKVRRNDVPNDVKKWRGLKRPISHFLMNNPDWVEEMNFVHNNGFFVVRRKSFKLQIEKPTDEKIAILEEYSSQGDTRAKMLEYLSLHKVNGRQECESHYKQMSRISGIGGAADILCRDTIPSDNFVRVAGQQLISAADDVAVLGKIAMVMGHSIPPLTASFVAMKPGATDLEQATEAAVLLMLALGRSRQHSPATLFCHGLSPCPVWRDVKARMGVANGGVKEMQGKEYPDAKLVVTTARAIEQLVEADAEAAKSNLGSTARIFIYGTALADATKFHPEGFELQTVLNRGVGVAVWEKTDSTEMHYVR